MKTINDLVNNSIDKNFVIIGAGASIKEHYDVIDNFIKNSNSTTIGVNNITNFWIPDYHLWTNNQRFRDFGKTINPKSNVLLGSNINKKVINNTIGNSDYVVLNRIDREGVNIDFKDGVIYGYFRTAGCLAIMLAHLMGANEINVVGMDGYTMHNKVDVVSGDKNQHCYGSGFTDTATWDSCVKKDVIIRKALNNLRDYGINFNIITPTMYGDFYDSSRMFS
jgi:hypothetical protein